MGCLSNPRHLWHELVGLAEVGVVLVVLGILQDLLVGLTVVAVLFVLFLVMSGLPACSNPFLRRQGLSRRRIVPEVVPDRREEVELLRRDLRQGVRKHQLSVDPLHGHVGLRGHLA